MRVASIQGHYVCDSYAVVGGSRPGLLLCSLVFRLFGNYHKIVPRQSWLMIPPANQANDLRLVGSATDSQPQLRHRWRRRGESIAMSKAIIDAARLWFTRGARNDLHERFAQVRKQRAPRSVWARFWALLSSPRGSHACERISPPA